MLLSIGIMFIMISMVGMLAMGNEIQQTSTVKTRADATPDGLTTNAACIGHYERNGKNKYGDIYCQIWLYKAPDNIVFWIAEISVNSENGAVLNGGYSYLSFYDLIGNSHTTSTLKLNNPDNGNHNIRCTTPMYKTSGGTAETVTYTLSGTCANAAGSIS